MVFSRLLITILQSSLSTRFNTVFSHTVANSVSLKTCKHNDCDFSFQFSFIWQKTCFQQTIQCRFYLLLFNLPRVHYKYILIKRAKCIRRCCREVNLKRCSHFPSRKSMSGLNMLSESASTWFLLSALIGPLIWYKRDAICRIQL